jgi:hypothetical protein
MRQLVERGMSEHAVFLSMVVARTAQIGVVKEPATAMDADSPRRWPSRCATRAESGVHNADEIMAEIVAKRLVEHLERAGFVVMNRPAIGGAALGRGFEG